MEPLQVFRDKKWRTGRQQASENRELLLKTEKRRTGRQQTADNFCCVYCFIYFINIIPQYLLYTPKKQASENREAHRPEKRARRGVTKLCVSKKHFLTLIRLTPMVVTFFITK
jgi:hypothetical protein